ncbi:hypothetical protein A3Q56_02501 [Intoshia linei]|uniref:Uncharacterized protein n=1 Tax=Intoshia linei TaxID=1819745 RepID=A0A177B5S8_9BILA|nr:hypothetical protein A3Q56_02501 [Intoshia linei]
MLKNDKKFQPINKTNKFNKDNQDQNDQKNGKHLKKLKILKNQKNPTKTNTKTIEANIETVRRGFNLHACSKPWKNFDDHLQSFNEPKIENRTRVFQSRQMANHINEPIYRIEKHDEKSNLVHLNKLSLRNLKFRHYEKSSRENWRNVKNNLNKITLENRKHEFATQLFRLRRRFRIYKYCKNSYAHYHIHHV